MIKSLEIKGLEKHKNSKLEFHDKINLIIGSSNTGKSSIVKSINLLINNVPNGNEFINHDMDECIVKGKFNKNDTIERIKSEKINKYVVNDKDYDSIGQTVPIQVGQITKFTDLNLRTQFERFFLLQNNPGEVARKLNEIVNLQIMDDCIKKVKSKVTKKNQDITYLEKEIIVAKNKLDQYKWIDKAGEQLQYIENQDIIRSDIKIKIDDLFDCFQILENFDRQLSKIDKRLQAKILYEVIARDFDNYIKKRNYYSIFKLLYFNLKTYNDKLKKFKDLSKSKKIIENISILYSTYNIKKERNDKIDTSYRGLLECTEKLKRLGEIKPYRKKINTIDRLLQEYEKKEKILLLLDNLFNIYDEILIIDANLKKLKEDKHKLLPEGTICPLCGNKIKGNK